MKKNIIFFCLLIVITLAGCSENTQKQSTNKSSNSLLNKLIVLNEDGSESKLKYDSDQTYCFVATWCPYSKKFTEIIRDPVIQKNLKTKNFTFLLGDEWPSIKKQLDELPESVARFLRGFEIIGNNRFQPSPNR